MCLGKVSGKVFHHITLLVDSIDQRIYVNLKYGFLYLHSMNFIMMIDHKFPIGITYLIMSLDNDFSHLDLICTTV